MLKFGAYSKYHEAMRSQYYQSELLHELNWKRTRELVAHAYENVPFYHARFRDIGFLPGDLKNESDFELIPTLNRFDIQNHANEMIARGYNIKQLNKVTTGGSTGAPLTIYHPKSVARVASLWRMQSWWGLKPGASIATIYRESLGAKKVMNSIIQWPVPVVRLNAASYTPDDMRDFIRAMNHKRPSILHGYVGAVDDVASYVLSNHIEVESPTAVWVTSAPLSAVQEGRIQRAFGAPVYDQYGSCEVFYMAAECPAKEGLHMFDDVHRIEFLDDNHRTVPDGKHGLIAVTDFDNYAFPLIRYLNGDCGRRLTSSCSCGRTLPLMDKVGGRVSDLIALPSGRKISGEFMTTIFDDYPSIVERFQVHQASDCSIAIKVVCHCRDKKARDILEGIRSNVLACTGNEVEVRVEFVDRINTDRGKLRFIISDVA